MARSTIRRCLTCTMVIFLLYTGACIVLLQRMVKPPSPKPIKDDKETLADFFNKSNSFFFGVATAPAHAEDQLDDVWLDFARTTNRVRAWKNIPIPHERLRFWSQPELEMELAIASGSTVFRIGIDWGRIVPTEPVDGNTAEIADMTSILHYQSMMKMARDNGLRIMLTLFHHSMPKWGIPLGGWTSPRLAEHFADFAALAARHFGAYVDYWITFNEPHIFVILSHCSGIWPPGFAASKTQSMFCFSPIGDYTVAMNNIVHAHNKAYKTLHRELPEAFVGVAHHVGVIKPYGLLDVPIAIFARWLTEFHWIDNIQNHLDFIGLNYYGQEIISMAGLMLDKLEEYSEAGRGVYPDGLYEVLVGFHDRYPNKPIIITENGMSDARDLIRRPYIIEHLLALHSAISHGVNVLGYLHWTISDNWEWSDGYCPKFGLVYVDRSHNLTRHPRESFYLYKKIAETGIISRDQRQHEWETLQKDIKEGGIRPFCRGVDVLGRMWADGLDAPIMRPISDRDWRFGYYKSHNCFTYVSRSFEVLKMLLHDALSFFLRGSSLLSVEL